MAETPHLATTVIFHPDVECQSKKTSIVTTASSNFYSAPPKKKTWLKITKIVVPHVLLVMFLFVYLIMGAYLFRYLESKNDAEFLERKGQRIIAGYRNISNALQHSCPSIQTNDKLWKEELYRELHKLSFVHAKIPFDHVKADDKLPASEVLPPRWTMIESVLYAVSILTTTGYTYVTPMTQAGQVAAVIYGLVGIPLAVLAAIDLGRFLSDATMMAYKKFELWWRRKRCFGSAPKPVIATVSIVKSKTRQSHQAVKHTASIIRKNAPKLTRTVTPSPNTIRRRNKKAEDKRRRRRRRAKKKKPVTLPIWVNGSILLLFCTMGAISYRWFDTTRSFTDAFFIAFNLVANLTMAEMTADSIVAVIYIVCFVTFGLVVLSMCADLAAVELKWIFTKIHYFGRRIGQRKRRQQRLDEQVHALLDIMEEIKLKHPGKTEVTQDDLKEYMMEATEKMKRAQLLRHVAELTRRNTQPFVPGQDLQFVDDAEADDADDCDTQTLDNLAL